MVRHLAHAPWLVNLAHGLLPGTGAATPPRQRPFRYVGRKMNPPSGARSVPGGMNSSSCPASGMTP